MNKQFIIVIILLIFDSNSIELNSSTLKLVQIVQRHGDRTPTNFYANDPYKDESYWIDGIGELTSNGKTRMFEFGKTIRQKYVNYLGYSPREVYARSSSASRTLESAQCFLSGLYRPYGHWIWNNDSDSDTNSIAKMWQPIAIETEMTANDGLLRTSANCPNADKIWQEFMRSEIVRNYLKDKKQFIEQLSNKTGDEYWSVEPSPLRPLEFLSTTLRVERENNYAMPDWVNDDILNTLRDLELHAFYFDWNSPQIQRLRAGLLLKELSNNMLNIANGDSSKTNTKKLHLYETHDVNQVVLLQALNVYNQVNNTPPTYTASMVFELHEQNDEFIVKLLYYNNITLNNTSVDDFMELNLIDCLNNNNNNSNLCYLNKFIDSIEHLIISDWAEECGLTNEISNDKIYFNLFSLVYLFTGIIVGLVLMVLIINIYSRFSKSDETHTLVDGKVKKYSQ